MHPGVPARAPGDGPAPGRLCVARADGLPAVDRALVVPADGGRGYPAFLWAVLAIQAAIAAPSRRQRRARAARRSGSPCSRGRSSSCCSSSCPVAILAYELGPRRRRARGGCAAPRRARVAPTPCSSLGAVVLAALGSFSRVLGDVPRRRSRGRLVPGGVGRLVRRALGDARARARHPAVRRRRRVAARERGASAAAASRTRSRASARVTVAALALEVTVFDLRFGEGSVRDRYLFYVAPLVLLGFLCALADARWPRWSLVLPTALVVARLRARPPARLTGICPRRLARRRAPRPARELACTLGARGLSRCGDRARRRALRRAGALVSRRYLAAALAALTLVVLPLETRLRVRAALRPRRHLGPAGHASRRAWSSTGSTARSGRTRGDDRPVSRPARRVLRERRVWWDSSSGTARSCATRTARAEFGGRRARSRSSIPRFDPATGRASISPTRVRRCRATRRPASASRATPSRTRADVMLIEAEQPWRTDWLSVRARPTTAGRGRACP